MSIQQKTPAFETGQRSLLSIRKEFLLWVNTLIVYTFWKVMSTQERNFMPAYYDENTKKWYCKFYYTDWEGQKKQKKKSGFDRKKDAQDWERKFLEQFYKEPDITFATLYERYKEYITPRIRESSAVRRFNAMENHILPFFKDRIIADITPADIAAWQTEMLNKGLSDTYLYWNNTNLKTLFNYAVDYVGLSKSPCKKSLGNMKSKRVNFWTPEEYHLFIEQLMSGNGRKIRKLTYFTMFEILYYTGMRVGELLALTLQDIDFEGNKGKDLINPTKTAAGERIVDIPEFLTAEIKEYISHLYEPEPETTLFGKEYENLRSTIKNVAARAGIKQIRIHDLRHSHASMLINLGGNPILVAERLGHESPDITLRVYSHLFPHVQTDIVKKIEKAWF